MNNWEYYEDKQKAICQEYHSPWKPIDKTLKIGVSANLDMYPIHGLRLHADEGTTGWFIWSGEYEERDDFFQPMCAEHLLERKPELIQYLALDVGFRFLRGEDNYQDVWFDETLCDEEGSYA